MSVRIGYPGKGNVKAGLSLALVKTAFGALCVAQTWFFNSAFPMNPAGRALET